LGVLTTNPKLHDKQMRRANGTRKNLNADMRNTGKKTKKNCSGKKQMRNSTKGEPKGGLGKMG